jgi:hypothetical protein
MKKNIVLSALLLSFLFNGSLNAQNNRRFDFTLQGGYNVTRGLKAGNEKYETKLGLPTIYIESHIYLSKENAFLKNMGLGLGVGFYHIKSEDPEIGWLFTYTDNPVASLYWVPIYLSVKYNLPLEGSAIPYLKIDNGYALFYASDNIYTPGNQQGYFSYYGGYYFSLSGGIAVAKFLNIELNYSFLNSEVDTDYGSPGYWSYSEDNYAAKILTLSLGVCF